MARLGLLAVAATGLAAGLLAPSPARAHEPDAYGFGSRGAAMAGAVAADATDASATYYNPAALVGAHGLGLSIGYVHVDNRLAIDDVDTDVDSVHGVVAGIVAPGEVAGIPFAFGIATFLPDDGLSRIKALRQEVPRWELYDTRSTILFLALNLAVRPVKFLEIGGGVAFLSATRGSFGIRGKADVLSPHDSQLEHEVDADLTSVRYPQAGLRVLLGSWGAVGLVYRGETKLDLSLSAHLDGSVNFAGIDVPLLYDLETRTFAAFLPQQAVLGVSFQKIEHLHVNADVTFVDWASYESPTAKTKAHLEARPPPIARVHLPQDPKPTRAIPPSFESRFVPRLGVEYTLPIGGSPRRRDERDAEHRLVEVPLRAGYAFERSPVPPQTGLTNFVDADRHILSAGTGVAVYAPIAELPCAIRLDGHIQYSVLPERATKKTNPADFAGDYRAGGSMVGVGGTLSLEF